MPPMNNLTKNEFSAISSERQKESGLEGLSGFAGLTHFHKRLCFVDQNSLLQLFLT
jgi:hypothetical protein